MKVILAGNMTKNGGSSVNNMEEDEEDWLATMTRTDYESYPHGATATRYSHPTLLMVFADLDLQMMMKTTSIRRRKQRTS